MFTLVLVAFAVRAFAGDRYICTAQAITGFRYSAQAKQWEAAEFNPDMKFLIRPVHSGEGDPKNSALAVVRIGEKAPVAYCDRRLATSRRITCEATSYVKATGGRWAYEADGERHFVLRLTTLRFLYVSLSGYMEAGAEGTERMPLLAIGNCSPF